MKFLSFFATKVYFEFLSLNKTNIILGLKFIGLERDDSSIFLKFLGSFFSITKTTSSILSLFKSPFLTIILFQPLGIKSSILLAFCGKFSANKLNEQTINNKKLKKKYFLFISTSNDNKYLKVYHEKIREKKYSLLNS